MSRRAFVILCLLGTAVVHAWTLPRAPPRLASGLLATPSPADTALDPRRVAVEVLAAGGDTVDGGRAVEKALSSHPALKLLDQRDRSFVRLLVATTARRSGQLDKVLYQLMRSYPPGKPGSRASFVAQLILRIGAAQLLFIGTPTYAAVSGTVDVLKFSHIPLPGSKNARGLVKDAPSAGLVKLVNAVLRGVARDGAQRLANSTHASDNVAPWLLAQWEADWGEDTARLLCEASLREPLFDVSVNTGPGGADPALRWAAALNATVLPSGTLRRQFAGTGAISLLPGFEEGAWWVQDAAAALPARVLLQALRSPLGEATAVDLCAAPGGKTAQLLAAGVGSVFALDVDGKRCQRLRKNLGRLGLLEPRCDVVVADGQTWVPPAPVDGVLLDAPCSATGTGRRRPGVLRKGSSLQDCLGDLPALQLSLCQRAVSDEVLAPGGVLVVATCSLLRAEGEDLVAGLSDWAVGSVQGCPLLRPLPIEPDEVPGFETCVTPEGHVRVLPGLVDSGDGFFVARFVKRRPSRAS